MKTFENILVGLILPSVIMIFVSMIVLLSVQQPHIIFRHGLIIAAAVAVVASLLTPLAFNKKGSY